jgi:hypothetical protein
VPRTHVFTEVFEFSPCAPGEFPNSDALKSDLDGYRERLRRASSLATFTRANGQTERIWSGPWRVDPATVRVLVTPPPWSLS